MKSTIRILILLIFSFSIETKAKEPMAFLLESCDRESETAMTEVLQKWEGTLKQGKCVVLPPKREGSACEFDATECEPEHAPRHWRQEQRDLIRSLIAERQVGEKYNIVSKQGRLILETTACKELPSELENLKRWTARTGKSGCSLPSVQPSANGCTADITDCVPEHIRQYQGINPEFHGPNCWNAALVFAKILPAFRMSSPQEMAYFMGSDLCRRLEEGEKPQAGDIGSFFSCDIKKRGSKLGECERHAFIHVSDRLVYGKNSLSSESPYILQGWTEMNSMYALGSGWFDNRNRIPLRLKHDSPIYYRCMGFEEYLQKHNEQVVPELKAKQTQFDIFECYLGMTVLKPRVLDPKETKVLISIAGAVTEYLKSETANGKNPKERLVLRALQLRLQAISRQLDYFNGDTDIDRKMRKFGFPNKELYQIFSTAAKQADSSNKE